jgi:hypothetical protein
MNKKGDTRVAPPSGGSRIIDANDLARFKEASRAWVDAATASRAAAREKLKELGLIDRAGKPTKFYR